MCLTTGPIVDNPPRHSRLDRRRRALLVMWPWNLRTAFVQNLRIPDYSSSNSDFVRAPSHVFCMLIQFKSKNRTSGWSEQCRRTEMLKAC